MIFQTPELTLEDRTVLDEIHTTRSELADFLRAPKRWTGGLRRHALAAAIRGSNSIEGYSSTSTTPQPPSTARSR